MRFELVEVDSAPVVKIQVVNETGGLYAAAKPTHRARMSGSRATFEFIRSKANYPAAIAEEFWVFPLDAKNRVLCCYRASIGTLTQSLVHPREVFRPALMTTAAGLIIAHNHPSGDPSPSPEDNEVTRRLKACADLLAITLVDHMIIGTDKYYSYADGDWAY